MKRDYLAPMPLRSCLSQPGARTGQGVTARPRKSKWRLASVSQIAVVEWGRQATAFDVQKWQGGNWGGAALTVAARTLLLDPCVFGDS